MQHRQAHSAAWTTPHNRLHDAGDEPNISMHCCVPRAKLWPAPIPGAQRGARLHPLYAQDRL
jgi:hypothetical protein